MLKFSLTCTYFPDHSSSATSDVLSKLNKVIQAVDNLHLKHRQLAGDCQKQRDSNAWNKAQQKRLKGILYLFCG